MFHSWTDPPLISVGPSVTVVNETNTTSFTCTAFGIPTPVVEWFKLSSDPASATLVSSSDQINITQVINGNNVTSVLLFTSPVRTDEAMYTCRGTNNVTNVISSPENDTVQLYVQGESSVWKLMSTLL